MKKAQKFWVAKVKYTNTKRFETVHAGPFNNPAEAIAVCEKAEAPVAENPFVSLGDQRPQRSHG